MSNPLPFDVQKFLPGMKFGISKEKLVSFYLSNKINGLQSEAEAAFIPDCDLYSNLEPWEIFPNNVDDDEDDDDDDDDEDDDDDAVMGGFCCFTRLKKISENKIGRSVGKGTWQAEGAPKVYQVKVGGKFCDVYHTRYFYINEDSDHQKRWSLHEHSCPALSDDVVICVLQKMKGNVM